MLISKNVEKLLNITDFTELPPSTNFVINPLFKPIFSVSYKKQSFDFVTIQIIASSMKYNSELKWVKVRYFSRLWIMITFFLILQHKTPLYLFLLR